MVLAHALWAGILANPCPMGLESALGVWTLLHSELTSHHDVCRSVRTRVERRWPSGRRSHARKRTGGGPRSFSGRRHRLWPTAMGTTLLYTWFSRLRLSCATRWDAALPSRKGAHHGRTPPGTCWLRARLLHCR